MKKKRCLLAFTFFVQTIAMAQVIKPVISPQKLEKENPEVTKFKKTLPKGDVWFYENANYTGKKYILERGAYNLKTLGMSANDFFSSALIPRGLKVVVYEDDNLKGDCYLLWPDYKPGTNAFQAFNANFERVEIWEGKNTLNQRLKGFKDINDKISSILIYDEEQDFVHLYDGRFYEGKQRLLNATGLWLDNYQNINGNWGYANLEPYGFNDILSSLQLKGIVSSCTIFQHTNFKGKSVGVQTTGNLKDVGYATGEFGGVVNSDWNDRTSSIIINFKPGKVTVEN